MDSNGQDGGGNGDDGDTESEKSSGEQIFSSLCKHFCVNVIMYVNQLVRHGEVTNRREMQRHYNWKLTVAETTTCNGYTSWKLTV
jgi:hypothetical protein